MNTTLYIITDNHWDGEFLDTETIYISMNKEKSENYFYQEDERSKDFWLEMIQWDLSNEDGGQLISITSRRLK